MTQKIVLLILVIILIASCTKKSAKSSNLLELKRINSIKVDIDFFGDTYKYKSGFLMTNQMENELIIIDSTGKIIKKIGRKGKAPGEFTHLYRLLYDDDTFMVFDRILHRISLYDSSLTLKNTFIIKHAFDGNAVKFNNKIITIGRRVTKYNLTFDNYKIGDLYEKKGKEWNYIKPLISVEGFNKKLLKFPFIPEIASLRIKNKIYILHSFLKQVIIYDIRNDSTLYKPFDYPGYCDINKIRNLRTLYNKYSHKYFRSTANFCSSPIALFYNKNKQIFLAEFLEPFQNWHENEIDGKEYYKYTIVLFDKNFNCLSTLKTNQFIHGVKCESDKFIVYSALMFQYYLGEEEPDEHYLNISEIDLSSY